MCLTVEGYCLILHTLGIGDAATRRFLLYGNVVMFH
jgi:hypothetical protein